MSMRVLCVQEDMSLKVLEVVHVWYSSNIIGVGKDSPMKPIEGLLMTSISGAKSGFNLYIENVSTKTAMKFVKLCIKTYMQILEHTDHIK
ncbi:MAG: hypothetical protein H6Q69_3061 [Firmicutes bacterium]|nr:hypothetical protein [Bacillota bacterium]